MDPHPLDRQPPDPHPIDLQPLWWLDAPGGGRTGALADPWGPRHRPDWAARGLIIWPRGGQERILHLQSLCPPPWRALGPAVARARLALRWWADAAELRVDGEPVLAGDLFDTACRWPLPERWWSGEPLALELRLRSPLHDDGALIHSRIELEPIDPADPLNLLAPGREALRGLRAGRGRPESVAEGAVRVLGHAHLDLAWLWPVADTWRAAERTFVSTLALMERFPELHFGHSTPALYAWLEQHRPALFTAIRAAMRAGRWEPLNGPWVESDCVLVGTASLLRQFQEGQHYSRRAFPEWTHRLAWLPDSFGFAAGLPAVAAATDVRWFCTHKLAWNASHRFPHRLFRWRSPCGAELLALMTAPIGTDGDPLAIEEQRLAWQATTGVPELLWLPGVGDHGGGPTAEMLEQLALWRSQPEAAPQTHGTLRQHLEGLEPLVAGLPVWRDELYLELHRGCATSRPDQKRHNRTLERLLREAELAVALAGVPGEPVDWRPLLFQQFHDILPGTSIPEVFEQAEPEWRAARRRACRQRDAALQRLGAGRAGAAGLGSAAVPSGVAPRQGWWLAQLQPLPPAPRVLRLPAGRWCLGTTVFTAALVLPLRTQLPWYSLLLWPPLLLSCGPVLVWLVDRAPPLTPAWPGLTRRVPAFWALLGALLSGVSLVAVASGNPAFRPLAPVAASGGVGLLVGGILLLARGQRRRQAGAILLIAGLWGALLALLSGPLWLWELNESWPVVPVAQELGRHPEGPAFLWQLEERPSLNWYAGRRVRRWDNDDLRNAPAPGRSPLLLLSLEATPPELRGATCEPLSAPGGLHLFRCVTAPPSRTDDHDRSHSQKGVTSR